MSQVVQQTDYDAFSAKLASLSKGYLPPNDKSLISNNETTTFIPSTLYNGYHEMHAQYLTMLKGEMGGKRLVSRINRQIQNSQPVMNYGTYLRTLSIDIPLTNYLNTLEKCQIVNLGCGSDLRCLQFVKQYSQKIVKYVDIDFKQSIEFKQSILNKLIPNDNDMNDKYNAVSCDLNNINDTIAHLNKVLDITLPTVFITECALCYMNEIQSQELIDSIRTTFVRGLWLSYDPIGGEDPNDRFGKIMKENLMMSRGLDLPTLLIFNSKSSYAQRWNKYGQVHIEDMWDFLQKTVSPMEQRRLQSLQFMDEIEELKIMQCHYVIMKAQW